MKPWTDIARITQSDSTAAPKEQAPPDTTIWQYHEATDSFSNTTYGYETVDSKNTFELAFPYQGVQRATLIYQAEKDEHGDIIPTIRLAVERGQFLCITPDITPDQCTVWMRSDDGKMGTLDPHRLKDGRTNILEFGPRSVDVVGMAMGLATMKSLVLQVQFYDNAPVTLEFDVSGLSKLPLPIPTEKQFNRLVARGY